MRFVTYRRTERNVHIGVLDGRWIYPITGPRTMTELTALGLPLAVEIGREVLAKG
ncbi:Rv2993c-like domain-containing protein [Saccharopolyspora sp. ASAGF58]|uniref:Rv2993c-like domain-containing protein n=1 Tax=Saccharopolyspora sp. ASAGF58 TaxID=2719023 RepID=UPI001445B540|nr:Rv2993c-like domain-containing protein [Saccharopolyspora sp. ASAGF58]